ncbi:MAG: LacI family transcriptional regulator [Planctomycetota bacterium]|nr:LacI family transcriptional regulator [Planctomycetota bacterium]
MPVPTITDVAKKAGVSLSTASDILNGKLKATPATAARVREAARELGYRPNALARRLRMRKAEAFGLVVPYRRPLFSSALLTDLLAGIQAEQQATGRNLVLAAGRYDQPGEVYGGDLVESRAVDGLIVIGTRESYGRDAGRDVRELRRLSCPVVWLHVYEGQEPVDRVARAGPDAGEEVLRHFAARGYASVGRLTNRINRAPGERPEFEPFRKRLEPLGLVSRPEWQGGGEAFDGAAFHAAMELLRRPAGERPRALLCEGDDLAVAALQAALGLGLRVPQDLALASTNNLSLSQSAAVPLTTAGAPASELGRAAVRRLMELIERPDQAPQTVEVPGGLIVRAST